jgi:hypothetical protein
MNCAACNAPVSKNCKSGFCRGCLPARRRSRLAPGEVFATVAKHVSQDGECWLWTGNVSPHGYGRIVLGGQLYYVHRLVRSVTDGSDYAGMHVHHVCGNKRCVRLAHLLAVTPERHRSEHKAETCPRGHSMADAYISPRGHRQCIQCVRMRSARAYAKVVAQRTPVVLRPRPCVICGQVFTPAKWQQAAQMCSARCRSVKFRLSRCRDGRGAAAHVEMLKRYAGLAGIDTQEAR